MKLKIRTGRFWGIFISKLERENKLLKKPSTGSKPKADKGKSSSTEDTADSIHKIRKKIEKILLEREEKKLWDL